MPQGKMGWGNGGGARKKRHIDMQKPQIKRGVSAFSTHESGTWLDGNLRQLEEKEEKISKIPKT